MGICIISRFAFAGRFTGGGVPVTLSALHYPPMKRCSAAALFESSPCQHKKQTPCRDTARGLFFYGPGGIRTLDLSDANRTLSQLSYRPIYSDDLFILCLCPQITQGISRKILFYSGAARQKLFLFSAQVQKQGFLCIFALPLQ